MEIDDNDIRCHHPVGHRCIFADRITEGVFYCVILKDTVFKDNRPCPFHKDFGKRYECEIEDEE